MRLIDADALIKLMEEDAIEKMTFTEDVRYEGYLSALIQVEDTVKSLPTIAPKTGRWVAVSEGLPEEGWCLCTLHGVFYDYCEILVYQKRKRKMRFFRLDDDGEYVDFTNLVTAWMPLPEPYREEVTE